MEVIEILGEKGNAVETVAPETPLADVVATLAAKKIGVIVVAGDDGKPAGIISERDVVGGLAADGAAVLEKPVSDVMTTGVETCAPNENVEELMVKMVFGRIRHLPVMDGGRMVGIVSIGDVVKGGLRELKVKSDIIQGYIMQPMAQAGED